MQSQLQPNALQNIVFPELNNLTNDELRKLGGDDDCIDDFLEKYSQLRDLNASIDDEIDTVEKIASKFDYTSFKDEITDLKLLGFFILQLQTWPKKLSSKSCRPK